MIRSQTLHFAWFFFNTNGTGYWNVENKIKTGIYEWEYKFATWSFPQNKDLQVMAFGSVLYRPWPRPSSQTFNPLLFNLEWFCDTVSNLISLARNGKTETLLVFPCRRIFIQIWLTWKGENNNCMVNSLQTSNNHIKLLNYFPSNLTKSTECHPRPL